MNVHATITAPMGSAVKRPLLRGGAREVGTAAIAQLVGVIVFASAAVIYGLLTPVPEAPRVLPPPSMDYRLTPTPSNLLPGDKPAAIVKGDAEALGLIVASLKNEMKVVQSRHGAPVSEQIEFVASPIDVDRARLSLEDVGALPPKDILGRTVNIAPKAIITIEADSMSEAQSAATKLISDAKPAPSEPFAVILRITPHGVGSEPAFLGLIKTDSRIIFADENFKVSEVMTLH